MPSCYEKSKAKNSKVFGIFVLSCDHTASCPLHISVQCYKRCSIYSYSMTEVNITITTYDLCILKNYGINNVVRTIVIYSNVDTVPIDSSTGYDRLRKYPRTAHLVKFSGGLMDLLSLDSPHSMFVNCMCQNTD